MISSRTSIGMILSLCDQTHIWGSCYEPEHKVVYVDIAHGLDVRLLPHRSERVHGSIMQPECTEFASSGAKHWAGKPPRLLLDALAIIDACLRTVALYDPDFWVLENPVGRLSTYLGPPAFTFNPTEYGEPWNKRTCLWGKFTMPQPYVNQPEGDDRIHKMSPSPDRALKRSIPPANFCQAFREYNL